MVTKTITETRKPEVMDEKEWERIRCRATAQELAAMGAVTSREVEVEDPHPDEVRHDELVFTAKYGDMTEAEAQEFESCPRGTPLIKVECDEKDALFAEQVAALTLGEHLPAFCPTCDKEEPTKFEDVVGGVIRCANCNGTREPQKQLRLNELAARPTAEQAQRKAILQQKQRLLTTAEVNELQTLRLRLDK